jgi:hypothetical protein
MKCEYCDRPGVHHVTVVEHGEPRTYHVCEEHGRDQPGRDGIIHPPKCPTCGDVMLTGWAARAYYHCPKCGTRTECILPKLSRESGKETNEFVWRHEITESM